MRKGNIMTQQDAKIVIMVSTETDLGRLSEILYEKRTHETRGI